MAAAAHFLTFNIVRLTLWSGAQTLGTGTGFFAKRNNQWWLVSNWHVFSGRNPKTGQPRHDGGATPERVTYSALKKVGDAIQVEEHAYDLGDALAGDAHWFQHPARGQDVDIGALRVDQNHIGAAKDFFDPGGYDPDMYLDLGAELFLPGYPLGYTPDGVLPIWKRASLASSLEFAPGINNYCVVDSATREGMSGAPCFAVSNWRHYRMDRATNKVTVVNQPLTCRLIGVYSGRVLAEDNFGAQFGIVWRDNLLFETMDAQASAAVLIR